MKTVGRIGIILRLALVLCLAGSLPAFAEPDWNLLNETDGVSAFHYDKASLEKGASGLITVWTRVLYQDAGRDEARKTLASSDYEKLAASFYQYSIDCGNNRSLLLTVIHRDDEGRTIRQFNLAGKTDWQAIDEFTRMDLLLEEICP